MNARSAAAAQQDAAFAGFRDPAFMANRNAPVHRWVPWVAGYSKHFVADALARFAPQSGVVLDPFSGVGTTLVEADLAGHEAVGFEINPYAAFASRTKLKAHRASPEALRNVAAELGAFVERALADGVESAREGLNKAPIDRRKWPGGGFGSDSAPKGRKRPDSGLFFAVSGASAALRAHGRRGHAARLRSAISRLAKPSSSAIRCAFLCSPR